MATVVMIDGRLCAPREQVISVFDRGFLYGDSVFEALRTYAGRPFALDAHLERLAQSAELVAIALPVTLAELRAELETALAAAGNAESYVRLMLTRGEGPLGLAPSAAARPRRLILVLPLRAPPPEQYANGVAAVSHRTRRAAEEAGVEGAKLGNYLASVLAMGVATRAGAAEAFILDAGGGVLEGATSNVFVVKGRRLVTSPVTAGILAGITRATVLPLATEQGLELELRVPQLEEAYAADELFISSSIRELMPIVRLDGRSIGAGVPGPVFEALLAAFRRQVQQPPDTACAQG